MIVMVKVRQLNFGICTFSKQYFQQNTCLFLPLYLGNTSLQRILYISSCTPITIKAS